MIKDSNILCCNEIRTIGEKKKVRYNLQILSNGLIICDIKISNPFCETDSPIECKALIDTGCDKSIVCQSVYEQFTIDETRVEKIGVKTIHGLEKETVLYPFKVSVTARNWKSYCNQLGVANLLDRVNYKAIIGIDFLRNLRLYIDWIQGLAWIED
jgi:hypothetical protein